MVYPYKEQWYATWNNGRNNADGRKVKNVDIFIKTFDGFDVYVNGKMVYFPSSKAKEMLAIMVEKRGSSVSLSPDDISVI